MAASSSYPEHPPAPGRCAAARRDPMKLVCIARPPDGPFPARLPCQVEPTVGGRMGPGHHHLRGGPHADGLELWWLFPVLATALLLVLIAAVAGARHRFRGARRRPQGLARTRIAEPVACL